MPLCSRHSKQRAWLQACIQAVNETGESCFVENASNAVAFINSLCLNSRIGRVHVIEGAVKQSRSRPATSTGIAAPDAPHLSMHSRALYMAREASRALLC